MHRLSRTFALVCLLGMAPPVLAATPISVADLEQLLAAAPRPSDNQLAKKLAGLELTQRLNSDERSRCFDELPGQKARQAFLAVADQSAFLDLPPGEIPSIEAPDSAAQQRMLALSLNYINETIHQLPNLFATRVISSYQETLWEHWVPTTGVIRYEPLHFVGQYTADVRYSSGGEEANTGLAKQKRHPAGLGTSGEFGLLGTVLEDAVHGKLVWSHWERQKGGLLAVYRYTVPAEVSHYQVGSSWLASARGGHRVVFQHFSGYRGEIAMDPSTGTILRLMLLADTQPADLLTRANILVDYGPVVLDGKIYVCPVHSVAFSLAADVQAYSAQNQPEPRFLQTSLNDEVFAKYHLFHADARILSGDISVAP